MDFIACRISGRNHPVTDTPALPLSSLVFHRLTTAAGRALSSSR